jgi:hypothetical protein
MNPKYKQYIDSLKVFRDQINSEQSRSVACKSTLEETFQDNKDDFNRGVFFGTSVVDEIDAKQSLVEIFKAVFKSDVAAINALFINVECDINSLKALHAMLAGYISSLVK